MSECNITRQGLRQYAEAVYVQPEVGSACLAVQDRYGVNVCVLLATAWLAALGRNCSAGTLDRLMACAAPWESILVPLRKTRRELRSLSPSLYEQAKRLELAVELHLLTALEQGLDISVLPRLPPRAALAGAFASLAARHGADAGVDPDWLRLWRAIEADGSNPC